jgi:asparagine synthase (glutamine-hydrolysing)
MCGIWLLFSKFINTTHITDNLIKHFNTFMLTKNRGPDKSIFKCVDNSILLGFHRLSIMDPSSKGDQPFILKVNNTRNIIVVCNGEIYNYKNLVKKYNLELTSGSDCEVIMHLYYKLGIKQLCEELEGEYAFIILDLDILNSNSNIYVCRDRFGIRPLFYSETDSQYNFSSEVKSITDKGSVKVFPPRKYMHLVNNNDSWELNKFDDYYSLEIFKTKTDFLTIKNLNLEIIKNSIKNTFIKSVEDRMMSDRPLGCLLSGGLDSSLVASIASKYLKHYNKKLKTFSIGLDDSTDEYYAKLVSEYINSDHTHIKLTENDFINALKEVIYYTETYDITTIRASTGQYLISKWISKNTDIKVLLIGDGSDELTAGYMYFHKAPTPEELHLENIRLLEDIHFYDVLRADRGVAENGLEARVPFLDHKFVNLYLSIDPLLRTPDSYLNNPLEKWLLRESFNDGSYLPTEVLFRKKEAFSDGVSSLKKSWYQIVQDHVNNLYSDEEYKKEYDTIEFNKPPTKEALYYRKIWEEYFGTQKQTSEIIPYFWLPKWCGNIKEPSARVLKVYNN